MKRNEGRIRTSHGGNLPLPPDLNEMLAKPERDEAAVQTRLPEAVQEVVDQQIDCGIDVVNDGEYVKAGAAGAYSGYIQARVTGWERRTGDDAPPPKRGGVAERDRRRYPGFYESGLWLSGSGGPVRPGFAKPGPPPKQAVRVCVEPVRYTGYDAIAADITALQHALKDRDDDTEGFIAALGPLSLGAGAVNAYYPSEEEYLMAVAEVMREEYRAITDAGLIVQI